MGGYNVYPQYKCPRKFNHFKCKLLLFLLSPRMKLNQGPKPNKNKIVETITENVQIWQTVSRIFVSINFNFIKTLTGKWRF